MQLKQVPLIGTAVPGLFTLVTLCGCNAEALSPVEPDKLTTQLIHQGTENEFGPGFTPKTLAVITTEEQYQSALLARNTQDDEANIDFDQQSVILLDYGTAPSAGYDISVNGIFSYDDSGPHEISVLTTVPGDNCSYATVITSPYKFYVVDAQGSSFYFTETQVKKDC